MFIGCISIAENDIKYLVKRHTKKSPANCVNAVTVKLSGFFEFITVGVFVQLVD